MRLHDQRILHSSAESEWRTPPECFQALDRLFHFSLDLAASRENHLCQHWYGPDHPNLSARDARACAWSSALGTHAGFLNPPYAKQQKLPIAPWVQKCWEESQAGPTIVALVPFAPQTDWYRRYVYGHAIPKAGAPFAPAYQWSGHAAMEEWRLPHRISFLRPDGSKASNAGVNSVVIVWKPNPGFVGPWQPAVRYWSYR